ncbi:24270_t:CDS:2 [Dentiscutata erythropus]|uniref:24270_t:CDS:1 n=1 Tax=Dentiscutata erythropus TaxID=1348616 RepID=A0A9N9JM36_9GLOM|nr:24270_t:CDS:2 [Dentiscutata erythropus]
MCSVQCLCATTVYRPPTFPHPAYTQFMEIVMKYHLPNSVGNELISWFNKYKMDLHAVLPTNIKQGHILLDSMNISHILYTKTVIMKHNEILFEPIKSKSTSGVELHTNVNCNMPCYFCLTPKEQFNNPLINSESIILHTPKTIKQVIKQNQAKEYSIQDMENPFWSLPNFNVYQSCLPDRMHYLDLGLYNYQVTFIQDLLKEWCGLAEIAEFDIRLAKILQFPGLKLFNKGLGNIKRFTATEFCAMMQQLVFVIDGIIVKLYKDIYTTNQAKNMNKQLVTLYIDWNRMYIFSRKDEFSESELYTFKVRCQYILKYLNQLKKPITSNNKLPPYLLIGNHTRFELSLFEDFVNSHNATH